MHKILLVILFLVILFYPQFEALAKTVPVCSSDTAIDSSKPLEVDNRGECPDDDHICYLELPSTVLGKPVNRIICYKSGSASAGTAKVAPALPGTAAAPAAPAEDPCKDRKDCTSAEAVPCPDGLPGIMTAIGCVPTEPKALVEGLLKYGTLAAGGIAFLIMILAALQMITAEGNPESIKAGQEKFYSAIIGLLLIVFSVLLMQVIGVDILGLKGFGK